MGFPAINKNKSMTFARKWTELEIIMLREATQKNKYIFSKTCV